MDNAVLHGGGSLNDSLVFALPQWIALASAIIAVISLLVNLRVLRMIVSARDDRLQVERESAHLRWSEDSITALVEAERICLDKDWLKPDEFRRRQSDYSAQLSSLVDRGRLFYPSSDPSRYGDRRASSSARKQDALEALFQAHLTLRNIEPSEKGSSVTAAAQRLFEHRKAFVEEVFTVINPRRRLAKPFGSDMRKAERAFQARKRGEARLEPRKAA